MRTSGRVSPPSSSVKLRDPQFEGQTKAKLGNVPMRSLVERATNDKLAEWLEENPTEARQIVNKAIQAARARVAARQATRRHSPQVSSRGRRPAGQADRLRHQGSRRGGAVHRRGRLSRWLGRAGP